MMYSKTPRRAFVLLQQKACLTEPEVIYATSVEVHCMHAELSGGSRKEAAAEGLSSRQAPGWVRNRVFMELQDIQCVH